MEQSLEKITQKGYIVLIHRNTVGWVVQLKDVITSKIVTELQHYDLEELLDELSHYRPESAP